MQLTSNITAQANTIVFIDAAVEDYQTLAANLEPGTEVVILDAARDGVAQITEVLRERTAIDSVQIVSHGSDGLLQLGTTELSNENLAVYEKQLQQWGEALNVNGDILLYGCNVAATDAGKGFIEQLSQITQAEIAASDDLSGNAELGGDWVLEYATGLVEAPLAFQVGVMDAYDAVLETITVTTAKDNEFNEDGKINVINDDKKISLREAILLAENGGTTTFINEEGIEKTITVPSNEPDIIDLSKISGQTIILNSSLPTLTEDTEFKGAGVTINGQNQYQIIAVDAQSNTNKVIFSNLTFQNGLAEGGDGKNSGGGGLGAGGALFINNGSVIVDNVSFNNNEAKGGNGYSPTNDGLIPGIGFVDETKGARGGRDKIQYEEFFFPHYGRGEKGGSGGRLNVTNSSFNKYSGGSGGNGGDISGEGNDGNKGNFGSGGGAGGGGGGGVGDDSDGGKPGGKGGNGGFGGGGGAGGGGGGDESPDLIFAINGKPGVGGKGGKGGSFGGNGTKGEDGKNETNGGPYGGKGGTSGGGAGLGGAIFVNKDANLTLINSSFSKNKATGGTGGDNNNGRDEGNNIFVMKGANVEAYGGSNLTGVYNDNQNNNKEAEITPSNLPTVSISSTNNATEKNSVELAKTDASFKLTLNNNETFPVDSIVNFTVGGNATQGTDYQLFVQDKNGNYELTADGKYQENNQGDYRKIDNSVTIPAGETSATINVATIDDKIYEGNETINIKLLNKAQNQAELTITDDEPLITLEKVQDAKEGGQLGEFKLTLDNPAPRKMNTIIQLGNGTAELGRDYRFKYFDVNEKVDKYITQVNNNNQFTIPILPGATEVFFQVDATGELINNKGIYDDNRDEGEEGEAGELVSIILVPTLENQKQKDYGVKENAGQAQLNILDGENIEDNSRVRIDKSIINVIEGGATDKYSLQLISKPTADVTVEFVTDTDLQTIQPITFTATNWNTPQTVTVKAIEDTDSEGTETKAITHKLSSNDTFYNEITIPNVNVQIKDRTFDATDTKDGLAAALGEIQSLIDDQLLAIELPIVGSLKTIAPDFIGSLKDSLITEIGGNNLNQAGLKTTIETAIKNAFGIDDFEVNTNITFDKGTFQEATFDITLGNTYNLLDVSLSSDLGLPALGINVDGDAEMTFDYSLGVGFGFHTDFGFFIDSEKTGFNAGISLGLSNDFKAQGSMGFLQLDLNNDADNLTEAKIDFNADLNDLDNLEAEDGKPAEDDGERLTYKELIGDYKLKELFDVGLSGGANIGLSALTSFNGDAAFPAFGFDFAAGFDAEYSILSNEEEESTEEESAEEKSRLTFNQPTLAFNNVDLDIGSFVSDFAKPVVSKINEVIDPFRPIIDLLNTDTKLLNKLGIQSIFDENGDNKVTVLEMALAVAKISGKGGNAKYIEFFDAITKLSELTEKINQFSDTDDSIIIELGSYDIDTSFDATDENADSTSATAEATEEKSLDEQLEILEDEINNIKRTQVDIVKGFTGDADFKVPILTKPALVIDLLLGRKDVSLFTYDLPVLQVGFEAETVFNIYPPVSGLLEGGVDVTLDLAFGYDTFGFNQWKALNFALEEVYRVFDGFYVSDTKIVDGKETDINELEVYATIAVGLGLDFKVISAYLKGGIEGIIGLDLVDGGEVNGTDDGKLRVSEIIPRLQTPWELFQLSGIVNVFLGGEVKVIGATVWDERLATFKLAEFSVGPKGNSAGSVFDGDIVAGKVFFDANFNNIQDEFEPYTYSNVDGSYDLDIPLYLFDVNANGVIDDEEGQIVVVDGIDSSIFIEQKAPIITTNDATVASPLTTLAVTIAEPDLAAAQTLVAGVFNLPDNIDLLNYDPKKVDLSVFAIQSQLQNLIIPVTKEISKTIPVSEQIPASEIANLLFTALGNRISSDINPDLSDQNTLTSIIEEVINQVEQKYSLNIDTIDIDQLAEIITGDNFSINDILGDNSLDTAAKRNEIAEITELPEIAGGFQQLVINPLATLTKTVVTAGNTATSQIQVKQALDIADVDLFNYDPLEAINEGDRNGLTVFAKQAQVQNTIVQLTKLVKGSSQESIEKAASDVIETIADKIASDTEVNLSDNNQVETLIKQTAPELENVAAGAADIITTGNKKIDAIVDDSKSDIDKALEIAKIQQVAQGEAADDLEEVGKGVKTIQDAVNENTGDGLVTQINATDVNNPTNRNVNTNEPTSLVLDPETQTWEITGNESIVPLKFALTGTDTDFVNEIGLFTVDDAENRIDGLLPGDAGYQEAALKRAKVIFSALPGNNPEVTRQLPFSGGMRLGFYMVANGTTDGVIQGGSNPGNIYFSVPEANAQGIKPLQVSEANGKFTLAWEDTPKLANTDFNDLLMTFEIQQQNLTLQQAIANFQGEKEGELFDLRLLAGREVQTDFPIVNSEASYNNVFGLYRVENKQGTVIDSISGESLNPGDAGYTAAAIRLSQSAEKGVSLNRNNQGLATTLEGGFLYAPFLIANGKPEAVLDDDTLNDPSVYFSFIQANSDGVDHVRLLGDNTIGFEDLANGGDRDYNDSVFQVNFSFV